MHFKNVLIASGLATLASCFQNTALVYHNMDSLSKHMLLDELKKSVSEPIVVVQLDKGLETGFVHEGLKSGKVLYGEKQMDFGFRQEKLAAFDAWAKLDSNTFISDIEEVSQLQALVAELQQSGTKFIVSFVPQDALKRDLTVEEMSDDNDHLVDDLNAVFSSLVQQAESEGGYMTAIGSKSTGSASGSFTEMKLANGTLLETYSFFSSGILSATLVSLFLVFILAQGLSWLGSLQVSYRALERPRDVSKKMK